MSYNKTSKTSYGDTDYSEDTWSPQGTGGSNQPPPASPNYGAPPPINPGEGARGSVAGGVAQLPYGQPMNFRHTNMSSLQPGQSDRSMNVMTNLASSITQEDILFMRQWQRDSFYYRVMPLEVIGLGSLYMFTKTRGLAHSTPKYLGLAAVAYLFGKWTYAGEFKRRLAENPSNTPYMQAMRMKLRVAPAASSEFSTDPVYGTSSEFDQWNDSNSALQPVAFTDDKSPGLQPINYTLPESDRLNNQSNDEAVKPRVTYDELRARNRGYIK